MRCIRSCVILSLVAAILAGPVLPSITQAGPPAFVRSLFNRDRQPSINDVAEEIDAMEKQIARHGTIVVKSPDVWGEARLTKHRDEFEKELKKKLSTFDVTLNASLRTTDQAFLANALAIQASATSPAPESAPNTVAGGLLPGLSAQPADPNKPAVPGAVIYTSSPLHLPKDTNGFSFGKGEIALEPTVHLDQLKRYINHLHEIRRINEGDDSADAPGYSMNLVRVPVSVTPGEWTDKGYGAEITMTATPHLTPKLLPEVFKSLVLNDLVRQIGLPLTQALNARDMDKSALLAGEFVRTLEELAQDRPDEPWFARNDYWFPQAIPKTITEQNLCAVEERQSLNATLTRIEELKPYVSIQTQNYQQAADEYAALIRRARHLKEQIAAQKSSPKCQAEAELQRRLDGFQIWARFILRVAKNYQLIKDLGILDGDCYPELKESIGVDDCTQEAISKLLDAVRARLSRDYGSPEMTIKSIQSRIDSAWETEEPVSATILIPEPEPLFQDPLDRATDVRLPSPIFPAASQKVDSTRKEAAQKAPSVEKSQKASGKRRQEAQVAEPPDPELQTPQLDESKIIEAAKYRVSPKTPGIEYEIPEGGEFDLKELEEVIALDFESVARVKDFLNSAIASRVLQEGSLGEAIKRIDENPSSPVHTLARLQVEMALTQWVKLFRDPVEAKNQILQLNREQLIVFVEAVLSLKFLLNPIENGNVEQGLKELTRTLDDFVHRSLDDVIKDEMRSDLQLMDAMKPFLAAAMDVTWRSSVAAKIQTGTGFSRNARLPFPLSQFSKQYGQSILLFVLMDAWYRLRENGNRQYVHYHEVTDYLNEELNAAYELLLAPENVHLWNFCGPELAEAARSRRHQTPSEQIGSRVPTEPVLANLPAISATPSESNRTRARTLEDMRVEFFGELMKIGDAHNQVTGMFAWAILLESALLDVELNRDLQRVSRDPNCETACDCSYHAFYLPQPQPEACEAFNEYVKCRWPIRVFAIDPVTQDQNVADVFGLRRELQLAAALSFASGKMNAQNLTRFVRRIEFDMETIALNRTAIGFGHGKDTFGWRFYPRVQTSDIESNLKTTFNDLLGGGPSKDKRLQQHRLEPGMRECIALIVMPSFLRHMRIDVRSEWFPLESSGRTLVADRFLGRRTSINDSVEWSRDVQKMQNLLYEARDTHDYRPSIFRQLNNRIEQLEAVLPLQTVHAHVPSENTLGGFELIGGGIKALAPQLFSYYGAPGIDRSDDTLLYLVGNQFSVHDTRVMAGNRDVGFRLLSRQVMEVTIPPGVSVTEHPDFAKPVVEVQVATPYGVSKSLPVPVSDSKSVRSSVFAWKTSTLGARMEWKLDDSTTDKGQENDFVISAVYPIGISRLTIQSPDAGLFANDLAKTTLKLNCTIQLASDGSSISDTLVEDIKPRAGASDEFELNLENLNGTKGLLTRVASKLEEYLEKRGQNPTDSGDMEILLEATASIMRDTETVVTKKLKNKLMILIAFDKY